EFVGKRFVAIAQNAQAPDLVGKERAGSLDDVVLGDCLYAARHLVIIIQYAVEEVSATVTTGHAGNGLGTALEPAERVGFGRLDVFGRNLAAEHVVQLVHNNLE